MERSSVWSQNGQLATSMTFNSEERQDMGSADLKFIASPGSLPAQEKGEKMKRWPGFYFHKLS